MVKQYAQPWLLYQVTKPHSKAGRKNEGVLDYQICCRSTVCTTGVCILYICMCTELIFVIPNLQEEKSPPVPVHTNCSTPINSETTGYPPSGSTVSGFSSPDQYALIRVMHA